MKKYNKYIVVFMFFLILLFLSPISGDDWSNFLIGKLGIRSCLAVSVGLYFDWEGRFVSRFLILFLTYHKWLFNIFTSFIITFSVYMGMKFISKSKKINFPLILLIFLGMNLYTFSETIPWIAGSITYLSIIPILLLYFYYLFDNDNYNRFLKLFLILVNLFGTMFVENMGLVIVGGNVLLLIYKYIKNKKVDKFLVICLFVSIFSFSLMLLSPGTRYRSSIENVDFNNKSLFGKIIYNIPNFINFTFINNPYLLIIFSISNYLIIKNKFSNKLIKVFLIIFMLLIPLFTIFVYPISSLMGTNLYFIIDTSNYLIIIYWLLYLINFFVLLIIDDSSDYKMVILFLIGLISNVGMLISPTWGFRTSLFTYIILSIIGVNIISRYYINNRLYFILSYFFVCLLGLFYLIFYINVFRCQANLEKSIKLQLDSDSTTIYIDEFPSFSSCNINPSNDYHLKFYKQYYNIPDDYDVVFNDSKWKYMIFYNK